jgi:hypothetical protein
MELNNLYQKIAPVLGNFGCQCAVDLIDVNAEEKKYNITYHVSREKDPDVLLLKFSIVIDNPRLIEKLQNNYSFIINEDTILTFVKMKNLDIIPHLRMYSGRDSDYNEIARVFYNSRGMILLDKFGI